MAKSIVFVLIGIFYLSVAEADKTGFKVQITNLNITTDPEFLNMKVTLRQENDETVVDMSVDVIQDIGTNAFIESEIFVRAKDESDYQSFMKGTRVDVCMFIDNPKLNPLLHLVFEALIKYGFQMTSCPIMKKKFDIIGFRMDSETFPPFIPEGEYRIEIILTRKVNDIYKMIYVIDCFTNVIKG